MDRLPWERIQSLFHEAADLPPSEHRAHLAARCADDPSIVDEVLALLAEDARSGHLLDQPLGKVADRVFEPDGNPLDREVGPYRLIRVLGEGGMGVVYLAERTDLGKRV